MGREKTRRVLYGSAYTLALITFAWATLLLGAWLFGKTDLSPEEVVAATYVLRVSGVLVGAGVLYSLFTRWPWRVSWVWLGIGSLAFACAAETQWQAQLNWSTGQLDELIPWDVIALTCYLLWTIFWIIAIGTRVWTIVTRVLSVTIHW